MKKTKLITSKVDQSLKDELQKALEEDPLAKWLDNESAFVRRCAEALLQQLSEGKPLAQPLRFLTEDQRRRLES